MTIMTAKVYKNNHYAGWFWRVTGRESEDGVGWEVCDYCLTKRGATWAAKRYMRKQQRVAPSFEVTL